jgi:hypothetical protein
LQKLGVPVTDAACRRLKRVMHDLGWRGPKLMRWGEETTRGYWRHPTVGLPAIPASARMQKEPVVDIETTGEGSLAAELEEVTRLALQKLDQILRIPTDRGDGNLLRAQTAAAGIAVNAQLRADEQRLRTKQTGDVFARLLKVIEREKRLLAEQPASKTEQRPADESGKHQEAEAFVIAEALPEPNHAATEDVELERSDVEASVMASGGGGSEKG